MKQFWFLFPILLPLVTAAVGRMLNSRWIVAVAPLPALVLALFGPVTGNLRLDWLLLGVQLGLDESSRLILAASALVWSLTAIYAADSPRSAHDHTRFRIFYLLAMSGNFILILAQDMLTFYLGFTLMGLSAYGLIVHRGTELARRAGRRYLVWALVGEVLLLSAVIQLAAQAGDTGFNSLENVRPTDLTIALIVLGFGIKLALPGLHFWLPASYAESPAAGASVLSGPMMSAGLLGWLRFLPPTETALSPWGDILLLIGMMGVVYGCVGGLLQNNIQKVLGYSSLCTTGVLTSGFGLALGNAQDAPIMISALVLYSVHHLFVKSTLFLGADLFERGCGRPWVIGGMILLGLALIGAPFTGGAAAKSELIASLPKVNDWFALWLSMTAIVYTLLMARLAFIGLTQKSSAERKPGAVSWGAWLSLLTVVVVFPVLFTAPKASLFDIAPLAVGILISAAIWYLKPWLPACSGRTFRITNQWVSFAQIAPYVARKLDSGSKTMRGLLRQAQLGKKYTRIANKREPRPPNQNPTGSSSGVLFIGLAALLFLAMYGWQ